MEMQLTNKCQHMFLVLIKCFSISLIQHITVCFVTPGNSLLFMFPGFSWIDEMLSMVMVMVGHRIRLR